MLHQMLLSRLIAAASALIFSVLSFVAPPQRVADEGTVVRVGLCFGETAKRSITVRASGGFTLGRAEEDGWTALLKMCIRDRGMPCVVVLPQLGIAAGERRNPIEQSLRLIRKGLPPGGAFRAAVVPKMRKDSLHRINGHIRPHRELLRVLLCGFRIAIRRMQQHQQLSLIHI